MEQCGSQYASYAITSSRCLLSYIVYNSVFFIIAEQIIWIKRYLTGSSSWWRGDEFSGRYAFGFINRHMALFGTEIILHLL
jgi:hypothetical protein